MKNVVNKKIRKEKALKKEHEIEEVSKDVTAKSLWNLVKRRACWTQSLAPTMLKIGESEYTSSPAEMANTLNDYFISKVTNICNNLKPCDLDPTTILRKLIANWSK